MDFHVRGMNFHSTPQIRDFIVADQVDFPLLDQLAKPDFPPLPKYQRHPLFRTEGTLPAKTHPRKCSALPATLPSSLMSSWANPIPLRLGSLGPSANLSRFKCAGPEYCLTLPHTLREKRGGYPAASRPMSLYSGTLEGTMTIFPKAPFFMTASWALGASARGNSRPTTSRIIFVTKPAPMAA